MKNTFGRAALIVTLLLVVALGAKIVFAQIFPTHAEAVAHVYTLATSGAATYSNPGGAIEPMPETSLTFNLEEPSLLTINFAARGAVAPSGSQIIPIVFVGCQIDGQACQPDSNPVEFLYPQFCCDTRAFQWAVSGVAPGSHTVSIVWGMGNPTLAVVTNRSLVVEAAVLKPNAADN